ncbi:uncharacterized protein LOC120217438 isoform X2 [Hibiscus syriacus]|uniref:uncharacterized protein LOC120217438 isoform X2 n=1 Tax=Hibiscus syriacus TaxID=106335 RepID=UPI0019219659|nr:uncharacterized protein LOC120217438 isoform X2 [Hibiscus syriacus]
MERNRKRKSRSKSAADDFSDINDAEISGYLNNKTEMLFKKLMWEAINKCYAKKKIKPATEKESSAKNAVAGRMASVKEKEPENKKRLSSKINYDALEKLTDGIPEEVTEKPKELSKGTSKFEVRDFEEDNYSDELESENANLYSYADEEEEYDCREGYDDYEEF